MFKKENILKRSLIVVIDKKLYNIANISYLCHPGIVSFN